MRLTSFSWAVSRRRVLGPIAALTMPAVAAFAVIGMSHTAAQAQVSGFAVKPTPFCDQLPDDAPDDAECKDRPEPKTKPKPTPFCDQLPGDAPDDAECKDRPEPKTTEPKTTDEPTDDGVAFCDDLAKADRSDAKANGDCKDRPAPSTSTTPSTTQAPKTTTIIQTTPPTSLQPPTKSQI